MGGERRVRLEIDGWNKDEWMTRGVQVFEVRRRLADGTWGTRLLFFLRGNKRRTLPTDSQKAWLVNQSHDLRHDVVKP